MTDKELDKLKLDIILRRVGGRNGFKGYLTLMMIMLSVTLIGILVVFIMYANAIRN